MIAFIMPLLIFSIVYVLVLELVIFLRHKSLQRKILKIEELNSKLNTLNTLSSLLLTKSISLQEVVDKINSLPWFSKRHQVFLSPETKITFTKTPGALLDADSDFLKAVENSFALIMKSIEFDKTINSKEQFKAINIKW